MASEAVKFEIKMLSGVPEGMNALVLAEHVRQASGEDAPAVLVHVARDDRRVSALDHQLKFFAPDVRVVPFPAWDTVPYDRSSPKPEIVAERITALAKLVLPKRTAPTLVLTTVNAILQRVPPRAAVRAHLKQIAPGQRIDLNRFTQRLALAGYQRTGTVMEPGEFAVRGGIIDVFIPGRQRPVRLDFFGDTLESIKSFDAETQRTVKMVRKLALLPISEMAFGDDAIACFRKKYIALFGGATQTDPLYEAISAGQRYQGQEHWLPLYHENLEPLLDYVPNDAPVTFDHMAPDAIAERVDQVDEHYQARIDALEVANFGAPPYKPVPPEQMFLDQDAFAAGLKGRSVVGLSPFDDGSGTTTYKAKTGRTFAPERQAPDVNVFDAVSKHVSALQQDNHRVIIAAWTPGARERLAGLLSEHGLGATEKVDNYGEALTLKDNTTALGVVGLEHGFVAPDLAVIAEQDILGDRLVRPQRKARKAADVLTEATSLSVGDLVVHADHGIGRFSGLKTITALDAPHDCLHLVYAGGDRLYLPVENIELLSRYGSDEGNSQLDKLGGVHWQTRKARLKKRLHEIAGELIKTAAARLLREAPAITPESGPYEEFVARFPFEETEDQASSIVAVQDD
ncbi:MAG: transcription-repair coupling factor, partial [Alphaproteobacteria bacterium]|nr:transcription-repair coupling factor [Alphaproteobacteria bacterium]